MVVLVLAKQLVNNKVLLGADNIRLQVITIVEL